MVFTAAVAAFPAASLAVVSTEVVALAEAVFHAGRFNGGHFRGAAIGRHGFRAGFRDGIRAGLMAGGSRLATRTTTVNGQRNRVQCLTSDCRLWHSWTE